MNRIDPPPHASRRIVRYQAGGVVRGHAILHATTDTACVLRTGRALPIADVLRIDGPGGEWRGRVASCQAGRRSGEYVVVAVASADLREAV